MAWRPNVPFHGGLQRPAFECAAVTSGDAHTPGPRGEAAGIGRREETSGSRQSLPTQRPLLSRGRMQTGFAPPP